MLDTNVLLSEKGSLFFAACGRLGGEGAFFFSALLCLRALGRRGSREKFFMWDGGIWGLLANTNKVIAA